MRDIPLPRLGLLKEAQRFCSKLTSVFIYRYIRPFLLLCRDFTIGETATGWILGLISVLVLEVRPNGGGIDDIDDDDYDDDDNE